MSKGAIIPFLILLFSLPLQAAALVNINTADQAALETLKGIGPTKAKAIIDYRSVHGPFVRIEDIERVTGIGPKTYADMQAFITVGEVQPIVTVPTVEVPPPQPAVRMRAATAVTTPPAAPVAHATSAVAADASLAVSSAEGPRAGFWLSLAALTGLLGGSAVGVRYLRPRKETPLTAEEFEIE